MSDKRLKRSTLGAIQDWWNGKRGGGREPEQEQETPMNYSPTFIGVNASGAVITPGDLIAVTGFYPANISYSRAKKLCLANKLKLSVSTVYPASGNAGLGVALTGSKGSALRLVYFKDALMSCYFADVYTNNNYKYVDKDGKGTNDKSQAVSEIIFSTPVQNNRAIAYCSMIGGGLSVEEVDDEIDATLATKLKTKTIMVGIVPTITNDGYLHLGSSYNTIKYYGEQ